MKLKKIAIMLCVILITIIGASFSNVVNAETVNPGKYLKIVVLRKSGYGYKAIDKVIWKIVETDSRGATKNFDNTIYCIKGGPGFGSQDYTEEEKYYSEKFNMKDPDSITSPYRESLPDPDSSSYKSLLWVLEHAYIAPKENATKEEEEQAEEYKNLLLEKVKAYDEEKYGTLEDVDNQIYLEDDDIDVVQQLAIWHFTNTGDSYDVDVKSSGMRTFELFVSTVEDSTGGSSFIQLDSSFNDDEITQEKIRAASAIALYRYLVGNAEEATEIVTETSAPYKLADTTFNVEEKENNYIIGPFRIDTVSETESTLNWKIETADGGTPEVHFQDALGSEITDLNKVLSKTVGQGQEFYIVVPTSTDINQMKFTISGSYYNTKIEYWAVKDNPEEEQPVAIIDREEVEYVDEVIITNEEPEPEVFDLALRKFITSINNVSPTISREPQISDETLENLKNGTITTAEKVHSKNPLTVKTGDSVIYTIRVYNEGDIDGYVTEITDYLPDGLKLKTGSEINTTYKWIDNGDGTITTDYLEGQVIKAFDGEKLDYKDVQIECEVTAVVSDEDTKLKNIAEITGATDIDGNIIPDDLIDRDSTPDNVDVPGYGNESQEDDDDFEDLIIFGQYFDLALRKFIVQVRETELKAEDGTYLREPDVDVTPLTSGTETTAIYKHPKEPVKVAVGDEIIYTLRIYNEGQIDGYVYEIRDSLPANLEFVNDDFNASYGWKISSDGRTVSTDITSPDTELSASRDTIYADRENGVLLKAFDGTELDYIDVKIKCKVKASAEPEEKLTNIAEILKTTNADKEEVVDRDSEEGNLKVPTDQELPNYKDEEINRGDEYIPGNEDDDDFEKVVIEKFDLALRKFITGVNEEEITNRYPVFNNNNGEYTYTHTKEPVEVETGDIVTYTIRVYNEGDIAGYAEEVKDDLPVGLEFLPDNTTNINYRWVMYDASGAVTEDVANAETIRTDYLSKAQADATGRDNLIKGFDPDTMTEPDYKEVRIAFKVVEPNTSERILINTAEISEDADEEGNPVEDVDSTPDNNEPEEDDIDIEKVKVNYFDLALRKFITGVNDDNITNRVPIFTNENGEFTYTHTKEPVEVVNGDVVIYTIRVYNEGTQSGYAEEVKDDLPEGLEFLPDNEVNKEYRWVMYDAGGTVTEDVTNAETIRTDYLSKAQADATGRDNLIKAFDPDTMTQPDYKDVKIAFKVSEPNTSDRVLINTAEVSEDSNEDGEPVEDIDSTPDNNEPEEDDIDIEKVKVSYFDLALRKIISEVTVIMDGETYVDETGHHFEDEPEEVVKIELGTRKIEEAIIKFTYQIRITNEGNKAGYAYEIKDYIPEGLEFVAEDNEGWVLSEDGKTVTTDKLKDTLLEPGESAIVEITLRWINADDNLGVKTNWAEISEDSDDDIDSTPDNFEPEEDDIDKAEVVLSIVTGVGEHYAGLVFTVLVMLASGIILIKKFVL